MKQFKRALAILFVTLIIALPIKAIKAQEPRFIDYYGLVSNTEAERIEQRLDEISEHHGVDVVILIVNGLNGKNIVDYADDYFDYNGYGVGPEKSGIIFIIDMKERRTWFSTSGYCIDAFTDYGLELLADTIYNDLAQENWYGCFMKYADECCRYMDLYEEGTPIDYYQGDPDPIPDPDPHYPQPEKKPLGVLGTISGIISGIISLIASLIIKGKNKSVEKKKSAAGYTINHSFNLTQCRDVYLYTSHSRTPKPRDDDSNHNHSRGQGSSVHESKSGNMHGGGGGRKF